ncbi:MAG: RNA polymerase sigma factor, partial [Candidatus Poribacteria bacterium]|nr:RNA polymerase sigma factor [Candidatus Poribacteria bacterium]
TRIYVLVLSYIKNPADAEDLTQRIFIRAYERLATLRELGCFLPWLQQIAHNTCKDWLRRRSESVASLEAVKSSDFSETAPSAEDIVLKAEVEDIVRKAIDGLKETDRKLMEAHYIDGASYDELRDESGLSYAAIANRLKRAKREVRRRVRRLLGGVMIVPSQKFIWGGFETVKLSVKAKLAAVAVTAAIGIGIGGGGVLYHHTSQLGPIVVNGQEVSEARMVAMDPSTDMSSTTYANAAEISVKDEAPISQMSEIDHYEITKATKHYGVEIFEEQFVHKLLEGLAEEIETTVPNDDIDSVGHIIIYSEDGLDDRQKAIHQIVINPEMDSLDGNLENQTVEELIKKRWPSADVRVSRIEDLPEALKQEIERIARAAIDEEVNAHVHSTSIELRSQSTVPAAVAESTTIVYESPEQGAPLPDEDFAEEWIDFERLLHGEFSDEEWIELERLLDTGSGRAPPQQDGQEPLNAERQSNVEEIPEIPPTTLPEHPGVWEQQPDLSESNFEVSPDAMTEEWDRTLK